MFRRLVLTFVCCCLLTLTAHAEGVIDLIPDDSLGCVVIHRLDHMDKKIQDFGKRMNTNIPSPVAMLKARAGIAEGIDATGSMAVTVLPSDEGPTPVFYVPVDDYAKFIEQLDSESTENGITEGSLLERNVVVGKKGGHAVVTPADHRELLTRILSEKAAGKAMVEIVKELKGDHDVTAVLSAQGVQVLTALGKQGLNQAKAIVAAQLDEDNPALMGIDLYIQMLNAISAEVTSAACGLSFEDGGSLHVDEWVGIQPKGTLAAMLRDVKPHEGNLLRGLPQMQYVVACGVVLPGGAMQHMMDFSGKLMKSMPQLYGMTPEQVDKTMELAAKYFPDLSGMSFVLGVGREGASLYSEMLGAMHVQDAKGYIAKYQEYWKEVKEVVKDAEGSFLKEVKVQEMKLDDRPVLKVTMPIPGLQGIELPNQGELNELMEKFYGPDGMTTYLAAANDDTVLMAYTDPEILRQALQDIADETKQISQDKNIVSTTKQLPAGAHLVGYWNPKGTVAFANRTMRIMMGEGNGIQLPAFPETPPIGFAMTATSTGLRFNTVLPAETVQAVGAFVEKVKQRNEAAID